MGVAIVEMGVEDKMTPEDQHGGYFHPSQIEAENARSLKEKC